MTMLAEESRAKGAAAMPHSERIAAKKTPVSAAASSAEPANLSAAIARAFIDAGRA